MATDTTLTTGKSLPATHPEDYYTKPLGTAAVFGCRAEASFRYDGPTDENMTSWSTSIVSTHDSIEQVFVPDPFTVDRDAAPEARIIALIERRRKRMDGKTEPYAAVQIAVPVVYTDSMGVSHRGSYAMEYVSSANAQDQTSVGSWLPVYGQTFGCYKPLANIYIQPDGDDVVDIYVDRLGKRVMSMSFTRGEEVVDSGNPFGGEGRSTTFTLREIPNVNFTAYTERSVCVKEGFTTPPKKFFHATARVELANDDVYQLGDLVRTGLGDTFVSVQEITKEDYVDHYVLEYLPVDEAPLTESQKNGSALFVGDTRR
jgi:hypothetical protein